MARHDIMPHNSPHGGHDRIVHAKMGASSTSSTANTSWREGEVLLLDTSAGDVNVIADGVEAVTTNHYIAAVSSAGLFEATGKTSGTDSDISVPMYPLTGADAPYFVTQYVVTNSDTQLTTAQKDAINVGDTVGLWRDNTAVTNGENGRFSVDTNSTGLKLVQKLDADFNDSDISGEATVYFVVTSNQA